MAGKSDFSMKQLADQVQWALQNSRGGMGGIAAMMGVPFQQKTGGQWMTIDPRRQAIYASGTTPPPRAPAPEDPDAAKTGGPGPLTTSEADAAMLKAGLPDWWIKWRNSQGAIGGANGIPGLLG